MTHSLSQRPIKRIGFVVDHPKRDLPGGAMLAHALGRLGIETALIPLYDQAVDVPLLGLDALVVNYARPVNLELVRGYRDAGLPVWVLDTEGGVLADDGANSPDRLATYMRDSGYAKLLAGYFFWGSILHEAFIRHSGMPRDRLHLTGCPRFDFTAARWRSLLDFHRDGYVLVNMNFPLVNPLFAKSTNAERETLVAAGWQPEYVDRLIDDSGKILAGFVSLVQGLSRRHGALQFLVRPHPFENADHYRSAFAGLANVVVDGQGSVLNVIQHSCCILHINCGTSIESVMLGKLPLSLEFLNTKHMANHSSLPSRVSMPVTSTSELDTLLADLPAANARFDFRRRYDDLIRPWFHLNDGDAAARIATRLDAATGIRANRVSVRRSMASSRLRPSLMQRLQAIAGNVAGSYNVSRMRARHAPQRQAKRLDAAFVDTLLAAIGTVDTQSRCRAQRARHPVTGLPLASLLVTPTAPSA
jgi:surface carbohydrate biosynthesis protein